MKALFNKITGFNLYPFQERIASKILENNENMVITAPTGSGKTWLSCLPYIYAKLNNIPFADRLIYVLPQRTLVTAVANKLKPYLEKFNISVTVQMGSQPDDPFFEGDIIVTTIDQLLSTYIGVSFGSSRNQSNIAPAALLGSFIVVDEFHLLEIDKALATLIDLSNRLDPFSKLLLMTATASEPFLKQLSAEINGDYEIISSAEIVKLQEKENAVRKRNIQWVNTPITPESIVQNHLDRTLVVVNTVKRAQSIYKQLLQYISDHQINIKILCLHARFLSADRFRKESCIRNIFKKESNEKMIVIANQVVEVGLDISASVIISELCPANSLIQRIGRCTRYGEALGKVYIHDVDTNYLPYKKEIMERTKHYVKEKAEFCVTAIEEAEMVNSVHLDDDELALKQMPKSTIRKFINETLRNGDSQYLKDLIRDIRNIDMIIHTNPMEIDIYKKYERFSIPTITLYTCLLNYEDNNNLPPFVFLPNFPDEWEKGMQPEWKPLKKAVDIFSHTLVIVSPKIVTYNSELGLVLNESGSYVSKQNTFSNVTVRYSYQKETYLDHVSDVRKLIRDDDHKYKIATDKLSTKMNIDSKTLNEWAEWIGALHDVGKLTTDYVDFTFRWQREVCNDHPTTYLAHTDFNPHHSVHKQLIRQYKKPGLSHAPEGGVISYPVFELLVNQLIKDEELQAMIINAMLFAVIRHHGAYVRNTQPFKLASNAQQVVCQGLTGITEIEITLNEEISAFDAKDINDQIYLSVENDVELVLYWYFTRRLRLADQRSQQIKNDRQV